MEKVFTEDLEPKQAIIVYKQDNRNNFYLESRRIEQGKLGYQMKEGSPLSKKTISKLLSAIKTDGYKDYWFPSILPKNLLYYEIRNLEPYLIWSCPKGYYDLIFDKQLNIQNGQCHLPTLIFKYNGSDVFVYACKSSNPDESTILYQAPFHNVFADGKVCMGNAKVKKCQDLSQLIRNVEKAFFSSKFTHLQVSGSPIKSNLNTYLNKLIKKKENFDNKLLIKSKLNTIRELI